MKIWCLFFAHDEWPSSDLVAWWPKKPTAEALGKALWVLPTTPGSSTGVIEAIMRGQRMRCPWFGPQGTYRLEEVAQS